MDFAQLDVVSNYTLVEGTHILVEMTKSFSLIYVHISLYNEIYITFTDETDLPILVTSAYYHQLSTNPDSVTETEKNPHGNTPLCLTWESNLKPLASSRPCDHKTN